MYIFFNIRVRAPIWLATHEDNLLMDISNKNVSFHFFFIALTFVNSKPCFILESLILIKIIDVNICDHWA